MKTIKRRLNHLEKTLSNPDKFSTSLFMKDPINGSKHHARNLFHSSVMACDETELEGLILELMKAYDATRIEIKTGIEEYKMARNEMLEEDNC